MRITLAAMEDMEGIFSLLKANHISHIQESDKADGFVTTNLSSEQLTALITREQGVTIAKEGRKVLAFAMAAPWSFWREWPLFAYMIEKLPEFQLGGQTLTIENSYQYGPICIDKSVRGTGVFEQVFYASLAGMRNRYPMMATFINQINHRSYAAHTRKVPMTAVGTFQFNQNNYFLMACPTDLRQD